MEAMRSNRDTPLCADGYLPHDDALERAVLGALLLEPRYVADVRGIIRPAAFYNEHHAALYGLMCDADDKGTAADLTTITVQARRIGIKPDYVASLTESIGTGVEVKNHARQLADMVVRRDMVTFGAELAARARQGDEVAEWAAARLDEIAGVAARCAAMRPIGDVIGETLRELERRQQAQRRGECVGIPSGLHTLDRITGGWQGGQLVVLAARPAMGKTATALTFARSAAVSGVPVCIFSLEMPDTQLAGRMLVGASEISSRAFRLGDVTTDDWGRLERGAAELRRLPVHISDTSAVSMEDIRSQCRAMHRKGNCGMVIIDYLQLLDGGDDRRGNREREVAKMSRAAKLLAKELDVPVVLLAQLSRKVEERADRTPLLSDLRESGAIEQDADMVIFIDRPAVYGVETFDAGRLGRISSAGAGRLIIAKNREGGTGFTLFRHNESLTRITDYGRTDAAMQGSDAHPEPF